MPNAVTELECLADSPRRGRPRLFWVVRVRSGYCLSPRPPEQYLHRGTYASCRNFIQDLRTPTHGFARFWELYGEPATNTLVGVFAISAATLLSISIATALGH